MINDVKAASRLAGRFLQATRLVQILLVHSPELFNWRSRWIVPAIRAIEIGRDHPGEHETREKRNENLHEELADVMDQVLILCDKYQVDPDSLMAFSEAKLKKRFNEQ